MKRIVRDISVPDINVLVIIQQTKDSRMTMGRVIRPVVTRFCSLLLRISLLLL